MPGDAGGQLAGKQLSRKGPGGSDGCQVDHGPATCPGSYENQQHLELY